MTAKEAAKPFWNRDMLQQRLERILECASMEASSVACEPVELEELEDNFKTSITLEEVDLDERSKTVVAGYGSIYSTTDDDGDDEELNVESAPALVSSSGAVLAADIHAMDQSTVQSVSSLGESGPLAVRSAPTLHQRHSETFPITAIPSRSAHVIRCN